MFDINGDGKTDTGEEFAAYLAYEDMRKNQPVACKADWFEFIMFILVIYYILDLFFK